jgi:ParB/RepB/Spo0J family partition protein
MQIITLSPYDIKVRDGLERFRKDLGEVKKLSDSIAKYGQLQPIGITKENELVWGGRRVAACMIGGMNVQAVYSTEADDLLLREMEIEENLSRKEFTPAEEVIAVAEIHRLKQELYGKSQSGKEGGWTLDKTAESIGKTRGNVIESLQLAEMVSLFPELKEAKTKNEIKKTAKALEKVKDTLAGLKSFEEKAASASYHVKQMPAHSFLAEQKDNFFDTFVIDPPYGIDIQDNMMGIGGKTGGQNSSGITFDDSKNAMEFSINSIAEDLFRVTTHKAQGYIFTAPEFFYPIRNIFTAKGWAAYIKPIIWIKNSSGQANQPSMYPGSCYETILFLRKTDARLVVEGKPDWVQFSPIIGDNKLHPNEKPVALIMELLDRISLPGQTMIDCCMGSGASLEAAIKKKLIPYGCDLLLECYATTLKRLEEIK